MDTIVITIIVSVIASSGFWAFLTSVISARKEKKSLERKALLALLHDKLYYLLAKHISEKYICRDDYENLTYLYGPYKEMGGNGTCERLMKEVDNLPIKEENENAI